MTSASYFQFTNIIPATQVLLKSLPSQKNGTSHHIASHHITLHYHFAFHASLKWRILHSLGILVILKKANEQAVFEPVPTMLIIRTYFASAYSSSLLLMVKWLLSTTQVSSGALFLIK